MLEWDGDICFTQGQGNLAFAFGINIKCVSQTWVIKTILMGNYNSILEVG